MKVPAGTEAGQQEALCARRRRMILVAAMGKSIVVAVSAWVAAFVAAGSLHAQGGARAGGAGTALPPPAGQGRGQGSPASVRPPQTSTPQQYPAAQIENGRSRFASQCGFCHGRDAGGGESGPDPLRPRCDSSPLSCLYPHAAVVVCLVVPARLGDVPWHRSMRRSCAELPRGPGWEQRLRGQTDAAILRGGARPCRLPPAGQTGGDFCYSSRKRESMRSVSSLMRCDLSCGPRDPASSSLLCSRRGPGGRGHG